MVPEPQALSKSPTINPVKLTLRRNHSPARSDRFSMMISPLSRIILILPVMDLFMHGDYQLMLMGWAPLFAGGALALSGIAMKAV